MKALKSEKEMDALDNYRSLNHLFIDPDLSIHLWPLGVCVSFVAVLLNSSIAREYTDTSNAS